jgi:hypothetical protein
MRTNSEQRVKPFDNPSHSREEHFHSVSSVLSAMYDRVIEQAVRKAQDMLWANLPPTHRIPDDDVVASVRALVAQPDVKQALERGNDVVCAFALRAVDRVVSDIAQPSRATINQLWDILDQPDLNHALGAKQNSRMNFWLKKPPAS